MNLIYVITLAICLACAYGVLNAMRKKKPPRDRALVALGIFVFSLWFTYKESLTKIFGYQDFYYLPDVQRILIAALLLLIYFYLLPHSIHTVSDFLLQVWSLIAYLPMVMLYAFGNQRQEYMFMAAFCMLVILIAQHFKFTIRIPRLASGANIALGIMAIITLYVYGALIVSRGLSFNFNILDVYGIRDEYTDVASGFPFLQYFVFWQGYVINPTMIAHFFRRRQYIFAGGMVVLHFLLFSLTGLKSLLTGIFFVILILYFLRRKYTFSQFSLGLSGLVMSMTFLTAFTNNANFISYAVRRLLYLPALISFKFYEFFSVNSQAHLGHSIFKSFVNYPYDYPPSGLVANYMDPGVFGGANTGIFGDAYGNFGFVGMIIFSLIFILFLRVIDSLSRGKDWQFVACMMVMPIFAMVNSALLTTLLTQGNLFGLAMLWLLQSAIPADRDPVHNKKLPPPVPEVKAVPKESQ